MDSSRVLASRFSFFMKDRIVAQPGFNRWKIPPIAIAIHLCIGSLYSWSIFNPVLVKELGVVASAAEDWGIGEVVWVFSVAILFLGLSAAFTGRWIEEVGPRLAGVVAACLWGGGFVVGGLGIYLHQIWIVYLGYGVLGGCGLGLAYVSPVATLLRWFPDRRGMAAGMAIMGFGGGAIIAVPLKEFLLNIFDRPPQYLGPVGSVDLIAEQGAQVRGSIRADSGSGGGQRFRCVRYIHFIDGRPRRRVCGGQRLYRRGGDFHHAWPNLLRCDVPRFARLPHPCAQLEAE